MVAPIGSTPSIRPFVPPSIDPASRKSPAAGGTFETMVSRTVDALESIQRRSDAASVDFISGGPTELHNAMIAMEEASLSFQLTLAMRNKAVEAYQEIMRMQV